MFKSFKKYKTVPVIYEKFVQLSGNGDSVYEAPETLMCIVEGKITRLQSDKGEDIISKQIIYIDPDDIEALGYVDTNGNPTISTKDKLTINGISSKPIHVSPIYDSKGINIFQVFM